MTGYKLIVGILVLLFLRPMDVLAQGNEPPIPPVLTGGNVVLDALDWLTPAQEDQINSINKKLENEGLAQLAVVTLNDCGDDKQKFRNDLFRTWGIGHANDNDGLLILVCWYGGDKSRRSVEQETGYGMEGTLPDVLTGRVADEEFIPAFQANHPGDGLVNMVIRYDELIRQDVQGQQANPSNSSNSTVNVSTAFLIIAVLGSLPGLILTIAYSSALSVMRNGQTNNDLNNSSSMQGVFEDISAKGTSPGGYRFVLAEILSLLPILGLLYFSQKNIFALPVVALAYGRYISPFLIAWLILLILFYLTRFFPVQRRSSNWDPREDRLEPHNNTHNSTSDLLDIISDITDDLPSFGGGESGGGGSSKKF